MQVTQTRSAYGQVMNKRAARGSSSSDSNDRTEPLVGSTVRLAPLFTIIWLFCKRNGVVYQAWCSTCRVMPHVASVAFLAALRTAEEFALLHLKKKVTNIVQRKFRQPLDFHQRFFGINYCCFYFNLFGEIGYQNTSW